MPYAIGRTCRADLSPGRNERVSGGRPPFDGARGPKAPAEDMKRIAGLDRADGRIGPDPS